MKVFVRPNQYEPAGPTSRLQLGRFHSVAVDLSPILSPGQASRSETPRTSWRPGRRRTYDGSAVSVPTGLAPGTPVGWPAPASTGPDFNVYVLIAAPGPNEFLDVFPSNPHHDDIVRLAAAGITGGWWRWRLSSRTGGTTGPDGRVPGTELSWSVLHSPLQPRAPCSMTFRLRPLLRDWIEALESDGVTNGCGGGSHDRPGSAVSRAQMAIFLLKGSLGPTYVPPPATGTVFSYVPGTGFAASWIEDLAGRGITAGCGGGIFCPTAPIKRGPMVTLLVRAFNIS